MAGIWDYSGAGDFMSDGGRGRAEAQQAVRRARHAASQARSAAANRAYRESMILQMFAQPVRDCAYRCVGRPVYLLRAGRQAPLAELGLAQLRKSGFEISVVTVDQAGGGVAGDLRTVPMPTRSFDVVYCALLLDRISHVELVLDRFVAALRPGGLLLLRIRDRDCAVGLLDRVLPRWARRMLWARLMPGRPGPAPAIYEKAASDRGIQAYTQLRGLIIVQRETAKTVRGGPDRLARVVWRICRLIGRLSGGRLTDAHDEVLYVIRKPEDRFARVV
jgi:SAM-dependent methyltransferase